MGFLRVGASADYINTIVGRVHGIATAVIVNRVTASIQVHSGVERAISHCALRDVRYTFAHTLLGSQSSAHNGHEAHLTRLG